MWADWLRREEVVNKVTAIPLTQSTFQPFPTEKKIYMEEIYSHRISPNQQAWIALSSTLGTISNSTILTRGRNVLWQYLLLAQKSPTSILSSGAVQTLSISYVKQCICHGLLPVLAAQISHCLRSGFICYQLFGSNRLFTRRNLYKHRALLGFPDEVAALFSWEEERSSPYLIPFAGYTS